MYTAFVTAIEKYRGFLIAFSCLIGLFSSWGDNWVLTWIMLAGVIICSLIGISDLKQVRAQQNKI